MTEGTIKILITYTPEFKRQYKRLSKKYPSLQLDLQELLTELQQNPTKGTPLGNNAFKIRMAITAKNKGKSNGARVITYFIDEANELYLLSIYDKSEITNISDKELKALLDKLL